MILPLLIIFLVLVCAYLEYQKKINLHNKLFVAVICVLTFTICFSFIKKYDKTYESFEDSKESFGDKSSNNSESFGDSKESFGDSKESFGEDDPKLDVPKPKEVTVTSKDYGEDFVGMKEDFAVKNNLSLEKITNSKVMKMFKDLEFKNKKKERFKMIPRLKKNMKYDNFIHSKQKKEPFNTTKKKSFPPFVKDDPKCFKPIIYDDFGPTTSVLEKFYNESKDTRHTYIDNQHWKFPHKIPPPCLPDRVKLPSSVYISGYGSNVLELNADGDVAIDEEEVSQTNVGSIMPKFNFEERSD
jgi:hypothetical protein